MAALTACTTRISGRLPSTGQAIKAGALPAASTVQSYDQALYGVGIDSDFFIQYTPPETVYQPCGPGCSDEYDVYLPEPGTILLLGSGLAMLGGVVLKRRRAAGRAA